MHWVAGWGAGGDLVTGRSVRSGSTTDSRGLSGLSQVQGHLRDLDANEYRDWIEKFEEEVTSIIDEDEDLGNIMF